MMTKWYNGMVGCQAVEKNTMTVFDFYLDNGKLQRLHCHEYISKITKFDDVYNPFCDKKISEKHFRTAMEVFCDTSSYDDIMGLIEQLEDDIELQNIAKEVICKEAHLAAAKSYNLTRVLADLDRKK